MKTRVELSEFILPYVVIEVLMFSNSPRDAAREITSEICCVLSLFKNDNDNNNDEEDKEEDKDKDKDDNKHEAGDKDDDALERVARSGFSGGGSGDSDSDRMCIQSVFRLMDTLHDWVASAEQGTQTRSGESFSELPYYEDWSALGEHVKALLDMVPKVLLARAAISVDAQARALRYFELHARETQRAAAAAASLTLTTPPEAPSNSSGASANASASGSGGDIELAKRAYFHLLPDINTQLPPLSSSLADDLMVSFGRLGDSDSLEGVQKLRRSGELKPSFFSRICVLEHTEQHAEALQEYDAFRDSLRVSPSHDGGGRGGGRVGGGASLQQCFTERGRVRCLKEMGQLHAVLDQVFGSLHQEGQLGGGVECAVLPTAIEAAWE